METPGPASVSGQPRTMPLSLFVFALFYGGMTVLSGVLGNKQVALGPLAVEAGIFGFLLLVVLSSAVAELHGRAMANRLVLIGFAPLVGSMLLILLVLGLPAADDMDPARLAGFQLILGQSPRLMVAGIIAYGVSQFLNVTIFSRLRGARGGRLLAFRGAVASALSQVIDTLLFISIAFIGVFPIWQLLVGQMLAKVVLSLVVVPFLIVGAVKLGRRLDGATGA
ncbi:queuosine precursor transporter [Novosphingopyxis baekryungensis]|uniref:queuosine precursor transporter n=1 Tax=Novosphingopyxis baekryungensis TaxID=279369 RepID=UPI0003B400E8|nr:queuosine precursor transporter [Novosphingopyxis baekryungensis]